MPLEHDVYAPCPCGSGKKLKFCCLAIAPEMEKVNKLQEKNQPRLALQMLEGLEKSHPGNPWVITNHAAMLLGDGRSDEARELLAGLLAEHPEHTFATALHAAAAFSSQPLAEARPAIYRALQRSASAFPDLVGGLVVGLAAVMQGTRKYMAARQYLTLAMRIVPERDRQDVFVRLLEFDSNVDVPYPLRSVHPLTTYTGNEDLAKEAAKAENYAGFGLYEPAARVYAKLVEQDEQSAILWQNLGFCRAWDGNEEGAAEALHKAAALHNDFAQAVECETLAQLLDLNAPDAQVKVEAKRYEVSSVARLLTKLSDADRLARVELPPEPEDAHGHHPAGAFEVLDRPRSSLPSGELTFEQMANVVAEIEIFDSHEGHDHPPLAFLTGFAGQNFEAARAYVEQESGDLLKELKTEDDEDFEESVPVEWVPLHWRWHVPRETVSIRQRRDLEQQKWRQIIEETWPNTPLRALGGKTPREAADQDSLRTGRTAAVYVFDAFCERNRHSLDLPAVCRLVNVEPLPTIEPADRLPLNTLSAMQLHRLPVEQLNDEQLRYVLNRALLIHHGSFLYRVLTEVLKRPACVEKVDLNRVYMTLAELSRDQQRLDEALEWIDKATEHAQQQENAFEQVLQSRLRELMLRMENPDDPVLSERLTLMIEYYGPKIPQIRDYLASMCEQFGISPPWDAMSGMMQPAMGGETAGGVWTPGGTADEGSRKLWLPGQD